MPVRRRWPLHVRILLGLVAGVTAGVAANVAAAGAPWLVWSVDHLIEPFGRLFLRLIFMVVLPLIFSALVLGVAGLGDVGRLGRIGIKTLAYTVLATGLSVVLGLTMVNVVRPGAGLSPETRATLTAAATRSGAPPAAATVAPVGLEALLAIVPDNPLRAAVNGDMLAVMFFSLMVGIAMALLPSERTAPLTSVLESLYAVVMKLIDMAMGLAPYGVAALLFTLTSRGPRVYSKCPRRCRSTADRSRPTRRHQVGKRGSPWQPTSRPSSIPSIRRSPTRC